MAKKALTAKEMIEVINGSRGFVTEAADKLGVSRQTFYNYLNRYETVKLALENARERRHEMVENKLMSAIAQGNITAIIFYLKTQGKHLGYIERSEIQHDGKVDIVIVNWDEEQEQ